MTAPETPDHAQLRACILSGQVEAAAIVEHMSDPDFARYCRELG